MQKLSPQIEIHKHKYRIYRYKNTQAQSLLNDTKIVTAKPTYATLWRIKKIKKHELLEILDANKKKSVLVPKEWYREGIMSSDLGKYPTNTGNYQMSLCA